jgi:hypothetical protein
MRRLMRTEWHAAASGVPCNTSITLLRFGWIGAFDRKRNLGDYHYGIIFLQENKMMESQALKQIACDMGIKEEFQ